MSLGRQGLGKDGQPMADIAGPVQYKTAESTGMTLSASQGMQQPKQVVLVSETRCILESFGLLGAAGLGFESMQQHGQEVAQHSLHHVAWCY